MFQYVHHYGSPAQIKPMVNFSQGLMEDIRQDRRNSSSMYFFFLNGPSSELPQCTQCFTMASKQNNPLGLKLLGAGLLEGQSTEPALPKSIGQKPCSSEQDGLDLSSMDFIFGPCSNIVCIEKIENLLHLRHIELLLL